MVIGLRGCDTQLGVELVQAFVSRLAYKDPPKRTAWELSLIIIRAGLQRRALMSPRPILPQAMTRTPYRTTTIAPTRCVQVYVATRLRLGMSDHGQVRPSKPSLPPPCSADPKLQKSGPVFSMQERANVQRFDSVAQVCGRI
jgi:hypothetical protein